MDNNHAFLPLELWDSVFSQLKLPDLEAVNLVSKYFHEVVSPCLQEHRKLYLQASKIKADDFYDDDIIVPWLGPLLQILRSPELAFYVTEINTQLEQDSPTLDLFFENNTEKDREIVSASDQHLVQQAARVCFADWFDVPEHPEYKEDFLRDVENLEQSALLAILFCNLPNLQTLTLTAHCWGGMEEAPWLQLLSQRVHLRANGPLLGCKPFTRLQTLRGDIFNCFYGLDFESIAPFIALPSLRWLETPQNHEEGFDWPEYLPKSHVREILLDQSTVPERAIRKFAAQALEGPCLIRQGWTLRRHDSTPEATWNRLEVPFSGAKQEEHVVELTEDIDAYFVDAFSPSDLGWEIKDGGKS